MSSALSSIKEVFNSLRAVTFEDVRDALSEVGPTERAVAFAFCGLSAYATYLNFQQWDASLLDRAVTVASAATTAMAGFMATRPGVR